MMWTPALDETLRRCLEKGLSCSDAIEAIWENHRVAVTRNAAVGRSFRLGISSGLGPKQGRDRAARTRSDNRKKAAATRAQQQLLVAAPRIAYPPPVDTLVPRLKPLLKLRPNDCRWPYGDADFRFCAHRKTKGSSYCATHAAMAVGPGTPSERAACRG